MARCRRYWVVSNSSVARCLCELSWAVFVSNSISSGSDARVARWLILLCALCQTLLFVHTEITGAAEEEIVFWMN